MGEIKATINRIEFEWDISFIRDNGDLFTKQWEEFYEKYSSEYVIRSSVRKYAIILIASPKINLNYYG